MFNRFNNPYYRTKPCRYFTAGIACPYGDRCNFLHAVKPVSVSSAPWLSKRVAIDPLTSTQTASTTSTSVIMSEIIAQRSRILAAWNPNIPNVTVSDSTAKLSEVPKSCSVGSVATSNSVVVPSTEDKNVLNSLKEIETSLLTPTDKSSSIKHASSSSDVTSVGDVKLTTDSSNKSEKSGGTSLAALFPPGQLKEITSFGKFYAVAKGRKVGIFTSWSDAKEQVDGFSGQKMKSFHSYREAQQYLKDNGIGLVRPAASVSEDDVVIIKTTMLSNVLKERQAERDRKAAERQAERDRKARELALRKAEEERQAREALLEYQQNRYSRASVTAEYAKSSRSECRGCRKKIEKGMLRIGPLVPADEFCGNIPLWHHESCFWRRIWPQIQKPEDINGFRKLKYEDKQSIKEQLGCGGNTPPHSPVVLPVAPSTTKARAQCDKPADIPIPPNIDTSKCYNWRKDCGIRAKKGCANIMCKKCCIQECEETGKGCKAHGIVGSLTSENQAPSVTDPATHNNTTVAETRPTPNEGSSSQGDTVVPEATVQDEDLNAVLLSVITEMLTKMTVQNLKDMMVDMGLKQSGKKAELVNRIVAEGIPKLASTAYEALDKYTIPQLKELSKKNGLTVGGRKPDLIWRLLESVGVTPPPPVPNDLGPDTDLVHDPWDDVHPKVYLKTYADLDSLVSNNSVVRSVIFDRDFGIRDEHIERVVKAKGSELVVLALGNSDTGDGSWLSASATSLIASNCPRLQRLTLESCTKINDKAAIEIGERCTRLRYLTISGHDRCHGAMKSLFIDKLLRTKSFIPKLIHLDLTDQMVGFEKLEKLAKSRRKLKILNGDTERDCPFRTNWGAGIFEFN